MFLKSPAYEQLPEFIPALSVRRPWSWFITHGAKRIENRSKGTKYRGPLVIHAAGGCTRAEYEHAVEFARARCGAQEVPSLQEMQSRALVGLCMLVDCVRETEDPWFMGTHGLVLADVVPIVPVPWVGQLGYFKVPSRVLVPLDGATSGESR